MITLVFPLSFCLPYRGHKSAYGIHVYKSWSKIISGLIYFWLLSREFLIIDLNFSLLEGTELIKLLIITSLFLSWYKWTCSLLIQKSFSYFLQSQSTVIFLLQRHRIITYRLCFNGKHFVSTHIYKLLINIIYIIYNLFSNFFLFQTIFKNFI